MRKGICIERNGLQKYVIVAVTEFKMKKQDDNISKVKSRHIVCFFITYFKEELYMIRLYVASEKLVKEEKDICVRLVLPVEENEIWIALQKAEMESLDDCEISDVECEDELMLYREKLKDKQPKSLEEAIYEI